MLGLPPIEPIHGKPPANLYMKHRLGGWLPADPRDFLKWIKKTVKHVDEHHRVGRAAKHRSIQMFYRLIDTNTQVRMLFDLMWKEIPNKPPYNTDPTGTWYIHDTPEKPAYEQMLDIFDHLLDEGPVWLYGTAGQQGLVGFPFNAILVSWELEFFSTNFTGLVNGNSRRCLCLYERRRKRMLQNDAY
jgi:phosphatidylserine decarboxylase